MTDPNTEKEQKECRHCGANAPDISLWEWPRWFLSPLLLCELCWVAFFRGDKIEKNLREGLLRK